MRRRCDVLVATFALPGVYGGSLGRHFAGLGDGNIDKRKRRGGVRRGDGIDHDDLPNFIRDAEKVTPRQDIRGPASHGEGRLEDDIEFIDHLREGAYDHRAAEIIHSYPNPILQRDEGSTPQIAPDEPWQLTVVMLLGLVAVLVGLFVHFSTDPAAQDLRRRIRKKPPFHSSGYKKNDDKKSPYSWSEDDEVTEDDNYRGDTEGGSTGSIAKKRSPIPTHDDPTARLYYQLNTADSFRQQEHRLRRSATQQTSNNLNMGAGGGGGSRNRPDSGFHSPSRPTSRTHSGNINRKFVRTSSSSSPHPYPAPPYLPSKNSSGLGSGLEGLGQPSSQSAAEITGIDNDAPAITGLPVVRRIGTFTPTESFASITSSGVGIDKNGNNSTPDKPDSADRVDFDSPPISNVEDVPKNNYIPMSSPQQLSGGYAGHYSGGLSEMPTPRVTHTTGKSDMARRFHERAHEISGMPLTLTSTDGDNSEGPPELSCPNFATPTKDAGSKTISDIADTFPGLPVVPNLNSGPSLTRGGSNSSFHGDAPRSVLLEELQLVRMESGVSGPRWRTKFELEQQASLEEGQRQQHENMKLLREASQALDPADDPRNSIQHIRKDLTISSDASSSLSSKIPFSELKLDDVIGGGGFGQVWRAKWKGTPVAVKVLTGSAQAETVPKAVLEEFIAEINMVSGMRHPNICLFMGACLEPPNRAIVTELCENGSLWDALRSPLSAYQMADGHTRLAWPLNVYEPMTSPPPTFQGQVLPRVDPPLAPAGAWPWVLVKRVAAGTARGMCYLHSGNPPVLHRDLKSANILLDESYTAKLADFGLSRLKAVRSGMTGNCGTVQWMAPEVLCNEEYAEPADVFSFGIILWEMLTKECPYDGMTPIQCALSVLNQNKRPEIPDWCPQPLRALIKNCVERDPHSRPTFTQILAALDAMP